MSWSAGQDVVKASNVYMVPMYLEDEDEEDEDPFKPPESCQVCWNLEASKVLARHPGNCHLVSLSLSPDVL